MVTKMKPKMWLFLWLLAPTLAFAGDKGWTGLTVRTNVSWMLSVKTAVVAEVQKDSPAEKANIAVGDSITSIEGCDIPGCGVNKAKGLIGKSVGETVHLKLKRQNGEEYSVALVMAARPAGP